MRNMDNMRHILSTIEKGIHSAVASGHPVEPLLIMVNGRHQAQLGDVVSLAAKHSLYWPGPLDDSHLFQAATVAAHHCATQVDPPDTVWLIFPVSQQAPVLVTVYGRSIDGQDLAAIYMLIDGAWRSETAEKPPRINPLSIYWRAFRLFRSRWN
jgi:hypothetical protein